ncbi:hypothetical protein [Stenotrophomonas sp.]|uniref:hypothetical protein n=1 Tax=Stenotrophomonas sp. TaxID=69392 RepID=UPI0028AFBAC8|nr:hypothetical protein [Stenotrophomonas sp.]
MSAMVRDAHARFRNSLIAGVMHAAEPAKSLRKSMLLLVKASPFGKKIQGRLSKSTALAVSAHGTRRAAVTRTHCVHACKK